MLPRVVISTAQHNRVGILLVVSCPTRVIRARTVAVSAVIPASVVLAAEAPPFEIPAAVSSATEVPTTPRTCAPCAAKIVSSSASSPRSASPASTSGFLRPVVPLLAVRPLPLSTSTIVVRL